MVPDTLRSAKIDATSTDKSQLHLFGVCGIALHKEKFSAVPLASSHQQ